MISVPLSGIVKATQQGDESELEEHVFGKDEIQMVVSTANPLGSLSRDQLKKIFSGHYRDWREISSFHGPILIILPAEGSATRMTFRNLILAGEHFAQERVEVLDPDDILTLVGRTPTAISMVSKCLFKHRPHPDVKALASPLLPAQLGVVIRKNASPKVYEMISLLEKNGPPGEEQGP